MTTATTWRDFPKVFADLEHKRVGALKAATVEAATIGVRIVRASLPVDMGGLRKSTHLEVHEAAHGPGSGPICSIVEDQPHAAAMEVGTRPFTPPFAPILAWALRHSSKAAQTINRMLKRATLGRMKSAFAGFKATAKAFGRAQVAFEKARQSGNRSRIARARLRRTGSTVAFEQKLAAQKAFNAELGSGRVYNPAVVQFARAIWQNIRTKGIKGRFGTRASLPKLGAVLVRELRRAVRMQRAA